MSNCNCGVVDPKTIYGTSALSSCCGSIFCDECFIEHNAKEHPDKRIQDNPDLARRIADWLS